MAKSAEAFRTISEVADYLKTPAHVLRFWESRFIQIRPVKRAGGRRYYRPADMALLSGIRKLLHDDGLTIRGVQKILKERGVRHVADLGGIPFAEDGKADTGMAPAPDETAAERIASEAGAADAAAIHAAPEAAPRQRETPAATSDLFAAVRPAARADIAPGAAMRNAMGRHGGQPATDAPAALPPAEVPEAPMDVDVPTLPAEAGGTVHSFAPAADRPAARETAGPESPPPDGWETAAPVIPAAAVIPTAAVDTPPAAPEERQPAAALLRAMDALRARDNRSELKSVYLRLSDLRDRLARGGTPRPGN